MNTVLILDDDEDILNFLRYELKKADFKVITVESVEEAMNALQERTYLCAILDIVLGPNSTSNVVIEYIKDNLQTLPIIITSAYMNDDYAKKIEEKSFNVYKAVPKPFRPGQMTEMVKQLRKDVENHVFDAQIAVASEDEPIEIPQSEKMDLELDENLSVEDLDTGLVPASMVAEQEAENELLMAQDDINYRNDDGETGLMIFARNADVARVKNLVEKGADLKSKAKNGKTVIHYAAEGGDLNVMELLVDSGAKINVQDNDKMEPLYFAIINTNYAMVDYLIKVGARIDKKINGKTYLMLAMEYDDGPIFNRLLAAGIDPKLKNLQGKDIKQLAREGNKRHFMKVLNSLNI